jgi:hypothetical protein
MFIASDPLSLFFSFLSFLFFRTNTRTGLPCPEHIVSDPPTAPCHVHCFWPTYRSLPTRIISGVASTLPSAAAPESVMPPGDPSWRAAPWPSPLPSAWHRHSGTPPSLSLQPIQTKPPVLSPHSLHSVQPNAT